MSQQPQQINVADLDLPQLNDVKKQLDEELTHLTNSFAQLKSAQSKFKGCLDNLDEIKPETASKTLLVPLTNSLYVPGKLADTNNVIIDVGTGYYVSKTRAEAKKHYQQKVDFVNTNLTTLQSTIETKQQNMNYLLQVMQMKMQDAQSRSAQAAS
ncbi:subunit of tubulin prefoldin [Ceratobasidium sp. 370]|nr:subunit of tubulin prefoldin [Ceratobasidium sp. 370]